jgi:hypothetical protein
MHVHCTQRAILHVISLAKTSHTGQHVEEPWLHCYECICQVLDSTFLWPTVLRAIKRTAFHALSQNYQVFHKPILHQVYCEPILHTASFEIDYHVPTTVDSILFEVMR